MVSIIFPDNLQIYFNISTKMGMTPYSYNLYRIPPIMFPSHLRTFATVAVTVNHSEWHCLSPENTVMIQLP